MECVPDVSAVVEKVATPVWPSMFTLPEPICVAPSKNATVPVNVPAVVDEIVAVKFTRNPFGAGFGDEETAVVVAAPVAGGGVALNLLRKITLPITKSGWPSPFKSAAAS